MLESVGDGAHDIPKNSLRQKSKIFATSLMEGGEGAVSFQKGLFCD